MAEIPCPFAEDVRARDARTNPNTQLRNIRVNYGSEMLGYVKLDDGSPLAMALDRALTGAPDPCPMGIPPELLGQDPPAIQEPEAVRALRLEVEVLRVQLAQALVERDAFRRELAERSRKR